jgi:hypothetical protein
MSEPFEASDDRGAPARLRAVNQALARQNALLKQLVTIYDRLSGVVLQGAGIAAITQLFADLVGRPVTVLDPLLQPLAAAVPGGARSGRGPPAHAEAEAGARAPAPWTLSHPHLRQVLATVAEERRPLRIPALPDWGVTTGCVLAPIVVGDEVLAYLRLDERDGDGDAELDLLAVQHAATVYALAVMRERIATELTHRLKNDLLESLLLGQIGDAESARERALRLGYDPSRPYRVLALVPEGLAAATGATRDDAPAAVALRRRVLSVLVELVASVAPDALAVARTDEVVAVVAEREPASRRPAPTDGARPVPSDGSGEVQAGLPRPPARDRARGAAGDAAALATRVVRGLERLLPAACVTVGIGGPCRDVTELPRSYTQARRAVETARRFGRRGQVTAFEDLGIYRLLYQVADPVELRSFADQVLGPLVAYDRKHRADLVRSLAAYLRHHGNLQHAARALVVHPNTVSYRLQRIQAITGLDLQDSEDRLVAEVALKILDGPAAADDPAPARAAAPAEARSARDPLRAAGLEVARPARPDYANTLNEGGDQGD